MQYLVNNKKVRYNPFNMKKDYFLGSGDEAEVYKIGDSAYKFYKKHCPKKRLNKEEAFYLKDIDTKRILMPKDILLSKKRVLCGYSTKYIEDLGVEDLLNLDKDNLKEELMILKEDLINISNKQVILGDLNYRNTAFNKGIYLVDPGSYQYLEEFDEVRSQALNIESLNEYLVASILTNGSYHLIKDRSKSSRFVIDIFHDYKEKMYPDMVEYLTENIKEDSLIDFITCRCK